MICALCPALFSSAQRFSLNCAGPPRSGNAGPTIKIFSLLLFCTRLIYSVILNTLVDINLQMQEDFKQVSYSQTTVSELMTPAYANFGGKIHGGILLSLMDKVAYACASKHAGNYCVTVS